MGFEAKSKASSTAKLPLFSVPQLMLSPEPSSEMLTPPLQTPVSVPFGWEEQPGKPRACTALITLPINKSLELPPRLQLSEYYSKMITKSPFPTTFRGGGGGPNYVGKTVNSSSPFRLGSSNHQDSYPLFLDNDKRSVHKGTRLLGSWGQKKINLKLKGCKKKIASASGGSSGNSSYPVDAAAAAYDDESCSGRKAKMGNFRRKMSSPTLSHAKSHFWATLYEGFKQAITWKCRKSKKQVLTDKGFP